MDESHGTTTVLESAVGDTRGWYAWNDLMPPSPDEVHVVGEVLVPNPGVQPELTYRVPQGANPAVLLLELRLVQSAGMWPQVLTWKPVRYTAVLCAAPYTQAIVFQGDETVVALDVETVHLGASVPTHHVGQPSAGFGAWAAEHGQHVPRRASARSGEGAFPWMSSKHLVCFTGSLSRIQFDYCMDGVPYLLRLQEGVTVRVRGANERIAGILEQYATQRIIITVCGRFASSPEQGCRYLLAVSADPAEEFSKRLTG
ncbi:MAG TPA: hypothetical protein VM364_03715 [Vicinamibacterales bacterium]|nr:hypothetical protein [Vicinamibacterales bacterium]